MEDVVTLSKNKNEVIFAMAKFAFALGPFYLHIEQ